jgi:arylsulfatase A-like enzyme
MITCPVPFHQWNVRRGGREYRGVRTRHYTYARDLSGPWLLYDNAEDPYQMRNLVGGPAAAPLQREMDERLRDMLRRSGDEFLPGPVYMRRWNYE